MSRKCWRARESLVLVVEMMAQDAKFTEYIVLYSNLIAQLASKTIDTDSIMYCPSRQIICRMRMNLH